MARKTIYDIAKESDVSIATVSRVMNDSSEISDKTKKKVLKVADKMGYSPQANAQGLAKRKSDRIMVLVPVISNYFFLEVLDGIQDELHDKNYELNIFNISKGGDKLYDQIESIIKKQVADGYILMSAHLKTEQLNNLLKHDADICLVDEIFDKIDSVATDNQIGIQKAVNYFAENGYQRIAFLSASKLAKPNLQRIKAYKNALKESGLKIEEKFIISGDAMDRDGFTEKNGYQAMKKLLSLSELPEACVCASDIQAIGALKAMREENVTIPIIGYDDITISEYVGLSTVRQPMYEMGSYAVKKLLERLKNNGLEPTQKKLESELILRESTL